MPNVTPDGATNRNGEVETLWTGAEVTHQFVPVDGVTFHVVSAGDPSNPTVVFAHGFPESWFAWHHQMTSLSANHFCIAFDLKGYGQSSHPDRDESNYDYAQCATEWVALFDALGLDRFVLVSHDRGTVTADHLCAIDGMADRILGYVRMQQSGNRPHGEPRPPHELFHSRESAPFFETGEFVDMVYGVTERADGEPSMVHTPLAPEDVDRMRHELQHPGVGEGMSASFSSASFDRELDDRMNGLFDAMTMPVLFLQGRFDPGQHPHEYDTVTEEVANGRLEFVDAGHFPHLEAPGLVTEAIQRFLRTLATDPKSVDV